MIRVDHAYRAGHREDVMNFLKVVRHWISSRCSMGLVISAAAFICAAGCFNHTTPDPVTAESLSLAKAFGNDIIKANFDKAYSMTSHYFRSQTMLDAFRSNVQSQSRGLVLLSVLTSSQDLPASEDEAIAVYRIPLKIPFDSLRGLIVISFLDEQGECVFTTKVLVVDDAGELKIGNIEYSSCG